MRIPSLLLRCTLAFTLATPAAAAAQTLVLREGTPIPYRVELPAVGTITERDNLLRVMNGSFLVEVTAVDMLSHFDRQALPSSDDEARRVLTSAFMDSDSLLFGMMRQHMRTGDEEFIEEGREIRTLAGERSGYLRGRVACTCGHLLRVETQAMVKDGIAYFLSFVVMTEAPGQDEMWARIRDSFVPAASPPVRPEPARADRSRS